MKNLTDFCKTVETGVDPRLVQVRRINIPGCNVCTDLNKKNLFKTVEILFYNFVVHVP